MDVTRTFRRVAVALAATTALAPVGVAAAWNHHDGHHHHQSTAVWASPNGTGTTCTHSAPCTLATALTQAPAGGTVRALPGTYNGGFVVTSPVHLLGSRGAVIDAATAPNYTGILITAPASGSTVRGFRITGASGAPEPTPVSPPPPPEGAAIHVVGASDVTIAGNTITGNTNLNGPASQTNNPA